MACVLRHLVNLRRHRERQYGRRLVVQINMRVNAKRQTDITVTSQRLGHLGRDSNPFQAGDEQVPTTVKVGSACASNRRRTLGATTDALLKAGPHSAAADFAAEADVVARFGFASPLTRYVCVSASCTSFFMLWYRH